MSVLVVLVLLVAAVGFLLGGRRQLQWIGRREKLKKAHMRERKKEREREERIIGYSVNFRRQLLS